MSSIEEALGLMDEVPDGDRKRRVVLPVSHYNMNLEVEEVGVSRTNDEAFIDGVLTPDDMPIPAGGSPYVQLLATVADGPYEGESFSSRVWITPGKGGYTAFHVNACKAITHKPTNEDAYKKFGFTFEDGWTADDVKKAFRFYFYNLSPEQRQDFVTQWARLPEWDGKQVVAKVGQETQTRTNDDGEEYEITFNRLNGFWSVNDKAKGSAFVRKSCHPFQAEKLRESELGS